MHLAAKLSGVCAMKPAPQKAVPSTSFAKVAAFSVRAATESNCGL